MVWLLTRNIMIFVQGTVDILQKYPVPECDIWFIKFSCDFHYKAAAVGNPHHCKVPYVHSGILIGAIVAVYLRMYHVGKCPAWRFIVEFFWWTFEYQSSMSKPPKKKKAKLQLFRSPHILWIWCCLGNREGKIYVWEVQSNPPVLVARSVSFLALPLSVFSLVSFLLPCFCGLIIRLHSQIISCSVKISN